MIVNVFAYSEPYESDILFIKLIVENAGVDKWIIVDNKYTLRGDYKGHSLKHVLQAEKFVPYLSKIEVIEMDYEYKCPVGRDDYSVIFAQRDAELQYLRANYPLDTWVIISDLDEIIEFKYNINNYLKSGVILKPRLYFFTLDFDNYAGGLWFNCPIMELSKIQQMKLNMQELRYVEGLRTNEFLGYHYHNCFTKEYIWRKMNTYGHTNWTREMLDSMLKYNHGYEEQNRLYRGGQHCEFTVLTEDNSPDIVRNNLEKYKTNNVDINYLENRKQWKMN